MNLVSTRQNFGENTQSVSFSEALLSPGALNGGLYAPQKLPKLDENFFKIQRNYEDFALEVIKKFDFDVSENIFKLALKRYEKFDKSLPLQINQISPNVWINELFHGPTRAFKDMALQPFGEILSALAKNRGENYLIICATSGDTGPATLETFANADNIKVVCLYPANATSEVQRLQMINANAKNLKVIGIDGNFDDAQKTLKTLLSDDDFKEKLNSAGLYLSAANSVNFGRILFQIIYHLYVYAKLLQQRALNSTQSIDIIVPSGNFGNALGAYYAKKMGAKIDFIKIASNSNNILSDFFNTGIYDLRNRKLIKTMSPAMDILVSSNVERLLFDKFGAFKTANLMQNLKQNHFYKLNTAEFNELQKDFKADFCSDEECAKFIQNLARNAKLVDPHSATCFKMIDENRINVVTSTAQWVKFTPSMIKAIKNQKITDEKAQMQALANEFNDEISPNIISLFSQKPTHCEIAQTFEIKNMILKWIKMEKK